MSIIIGLNAYHGDSSACLVIDGVLIAAAEEESHGGYGESHRRREREQQAKAKQLKIRALKAKQMIVKPTRSISSSMPKAQDGKPILRAFKPIQSR